MHGSPAWRQEKVLNEGRSVRRIGVGRWTVNHFHRNCSPYAGTENRCYWTVGFFYGHQTMVELTSSPGRAKGLAGLRSDR